MFEERKDQLGMGFGMFSLKSLVIKLKSIQLYQVLISEFHLPYSPYHGRLSV